MINKWKKYSTCDIYSPCKILTSKNHNTKTSSQHSKECKYPRRHCLCDSWPWHLSCLPLNGFLGLIMQHLTIKVGDPSCVVFWDILRKKQTQKPSPRRTSAWVLIVQSCTDMETQLSFVTQQTVDSRLSLESEFRRDHRNDSAIQTDCQDRQRYNWYVVLFCKKPNQLNVRYSRVKQLTVLNCSK